MRDEPGVLGMAQRRVVEEGADGGQAGVPGAGAVVTLLLQVLQEGADDRGTSVTVLAGWNPDETLWLTGLPMTARFLAEVDVP